ncbi:hypothetical protein GLOIN_2v1595180 [Rhizophagus irregularis DAOM 181602=DAOM 197198]|uniref:Uncharacterized protein n=1 Tax=Rhizophagus irregularis (strain DAOM 181602 / DAOM 197198 / MUCL 43194) TaxID=747089 RepID=A0A2P4Q453_RHIID|nr:hypothetical protein GLOIN_2v1595180 [Rhizophagus irregularis DAOM 181602=DAOM 197198]PKY15169.1 hypothetical protein RhiirB3_251067 [Rhizophagus irregularis]POG72441.1 hypothetical protein GLOIN_2v1595180 [Rhizophagus irregularis DAOM 181602=DAOM 197198]GET59269.1 hypothetical protein GLOIN_2v1595180 [Rhizophagus irregularis DAOM 181602=DAOM 197198]|eukprot:XP_025179307.1 hypothetical protein GLOIN_2v1595180 [Rhizophagus irregularis DAOM 181602=DAOM 197198]
MVEVSYIHIFHMLIIIYLTYTVKEMSILFIFIYFFSFPFFYPLPFFLHVNRLYIKYFEFIISLII